MKRRRFLRGGTVAAGTAAVSGVIAKPALSAGRRKLSMVTSWPADFPGLGGAANRFARTVEQLSDFRITITVHSGAKEVHSLKCHDAVQQNAADLYHSVDHYYVGKSTAYGFFTAAPFGFTAPEMSAWIDHGGGQAIWDAVGGEFGVKHLACGNTSAPMGTWFLKPVREIKDFKGKKVAAAGFGADLLRELGATPKLLSGPEISAALAKKSLDGAEWMGPWADGSLGLHDAARNYLYPGLQQPGCLLSLGISAKLWGQLSTTDRALFHTAAAQTHNWTSAAFTARNASALQSATNGKGVRLIGVDPKVTKDIAEIAGDVLSKAGKSGVLGKKAYESFMAFRKRMSDWTRIADRPFLDRRDLMKS